MKRGAPVKIRFPAAGDVQTRGRTLPEALVALLAKVGP